MRVSMTYQVFAEVLLALKPKYYNNIAIQLKPLCMYAPKVYDNALGDGMALIREHYKLI